LAAIDVGKPVICATYPRSLCHATHDHFVTLDAENRVKSTITLSHKPIALKKPIYKPVVVRQNLWTIETNNKADTPKRRDKSSFGAAPQTPQKQQQKQTFPNEDWGLLSGCG